MRDIRKYERDFGEARIAFPLTLLWLFATVVQAWTGDASWLWVALAAFGALVYGLSLVSLLMLIREYDATASRQEGR